MTEPEADGCIDDAKKKTLTKNYILYRKEDAGQMPDSKKETAKNTTEHKKSGKAMTILRRILLVMVGLALGVILYFTNAQKILGNQLPMPFGIGIANVLSGSMEPTFSKGTLLIIKEADEVEKGDIVVYQSGNSLVVHRIIDVQKEQITTQGDANNTPDPTFDKAEIKGVVVGWIPYLGTILSLVRTPAGVIILLLLAFLLIEGSFRRQKDEDEQELEAIKEEIRKLKQETRCMEEQHDTKQSVHKNDAKD